MYFSALGVGVCAGGQEGPSEGGHRGEAKPAQGDRAPAHGLGEEDGGGRGLVRPAEERAGAGEAAPRVRQGLRGVAPPGQVLSTGTEEDGVGKDETPLT